MDFQRCITGFHVIGGDGGDPPPHQSIGSPVPVWAELDPRLFFTFITFCTGPNSTITPIMLFSFFSFFCKTPGTILFLPGTRFYIVFSRIPELQIQRMPIRNKELPALVPVPVNYFPDCFMSVKWHGCTSVLRHIKGGGPQGATFSFCQAQPSPSPAGLRSYIATKLPTPTPTPY